jgi:hypothetical protein
MPVEVELEEQLAYPAAMCEVLTLLCQLAQLVAKCAMALAVAIQLCLFPLDKDHVLQVVQAHGYAHVLPPER